MWQCFCKYLSLISPFSSRNQGAAVLRLACWNWHLILQFYCKALLTEIFLFPGVKVWTELIYGLNQDCDWHTSSHAVDVGHIWCLHIIKCFYISYSETHKNSILILINKNVVITTLNCVISILSSGITKENHLLYTDFTHIIECVLFLSRNLITLLAIWLCVYIMLL